MSARATGAWRGELEAAAVALLIALAAGSVLIMIAGASPWTVWRTLLDHSLVLYGSGMGDGDRHDHQNLPTILAGHAGGLKGGRFIPKAEGNFSDLLLAMMSRAGCPLESFGDGKRALPGIA